MASGGDADGSGTLKGFNQLYASSGYLGEARFLSLCNTTADRSGNFILACSDRPWAA